MTRALLELDAHPDVDVIIVTRGGGSLEDLLPFSDEGLVRTVAALLTPVISAIGHEADRPILDDVADARAATPTHAATLAVPQVADVASHIDTLRRRIRSRMQAKLVHDRKLLQSCRNRRCAGIRTFCWVRPKTLSNAHVCGCCPPWSGSPNVNAPIWGSLDLQLRALSPQTTLDRGYALVVDEAGHLVRAVPRRACTCRHPRPEWAVRGGRRVGFRRYGR